MLDGLILQAILSALVIIAVTVMIVWFINGITGKNAVWIIAVMVPCALIAAFVIAVLSG